MFGVAESDYYGRLGRQALSNSDYWRITASSITAFSAEDQYYWNAYQWARTATNPCTMPGITPAHDRAVASALAPRSEE